MNGSSTTIRRAGNQETQRFRNFLWISMLMSLAIVFFGMQLMMVGPLKGRLDGIQSRLEMSESDMRKLVASRDAVWKTNDLLTSLQNQGRIAEQLKSTIGEIQALRARITQESQATAQAVASLESLLKMQNQLASSQKSTEMASATVASMKQLQEKILSGAGQTEVASSALD
ncbi:MAG: hypothetical protein ACK50J_10945, partial [Planctomyces sp.]